MKKAIYLCLLIPCISSAELKVTVTPKQQAQLNQEVLSTAQLSSQKATSSDTAELFKKIPGLSLQTGGGVSALPVIHGLADDRVRIKVDGMDLISACGNHMNPPLSYIDASAVKQANLFAGISPVSMGGDSIAGAILVNSSAPEFAPPGENLLKGNIGAYYRSNGNATGGNIDLTAASEDFSVSYQGATAQSDNYHAGRDFKTPGAAAAGRRFLSGDEVGSSYYKSTNHNLGLAMQQGQHLWQIKLGLQDIPEQGWANQRMDMTGNDSHHINLSYQGQLDWGELSVRAYRENTEHKMQFGKDKLFWYAGMPAADGQPCTPSGGMMGCAAGMPMDTQGENTGISIQAKWRLSAEDSVRLGIEGQQYRLDDRWNPSGRGMWPNTFVNINDGQRDRLGIYAEWDKDWNTKWQSQLGARVEQIDMNTGNVQGYNAMMAAYKPESSRFNNTQRKNTDHNLDLTASLRYQPTSRYSMDIGYAQKTRSPNLYERYAWSTGGMVMRMINLAGDGNGYVGNLQLEPEVAHTLRAAFAWQENQQWKFIVAPHFTHVEDFIDAQRCQSSNMNCSPGNQTASNRFVYLSYANQSAQIYGIDLSANRSLLQHDTLGAFSASAVVSYLRGKNKKTDDHLYNIMPLNTQLALMHEQGAWSNRLEAEWTERKNQVSAVRNEQNTDSYHLLHLRSAYKNGALSIHFGIENIMGKFYALPLGGTYIGQGKTMSATGVAWGTALPGKGRSYYTGIEYQF